MGGWVAALPGWWVCCSVGWWIAGGLLVGRLVGGIVSRGWVGGGISRWVGAGVARWVGGWEAVLLGLGGWVAVLCTLREQPINVRLKERVNLTSSFGVLPTTWCHCARLPSRFRKVAGTIHALRCGR